MKILTVVAVRAFTRLFRQMTTVFAYAVFLSVSGALFADGLFAAEGTTVSAPSVWALSVARALPLLVALLTMRLWSCDGIPERTEADLVVPVPERVFAVGRFAAAYAAVLAAVALSLLTPLAVLPACSPAASSHPGFVRFLPAYAALAVFALPLTAAGSMAGVLFRNAASAATATAAVTWVIPYAAFRALMSWSPAARMRFAESPVMSQIADAADGFMSFGSAVVAFAFTALALFIASKAFAMRRIAGGGRAVLKLSTLAAVLSAAFAATSLSMLAVRLDFTVQWPGAARTASISARTREILSEISRPVRISACIRRDSSAFLPVARLLRLIETESRSVAGAGVRCEFADPRWNPSAAGRLSRAGAGEDTVMFASGRNRIVVPVENFDEGACASAIQRLSRSARSETVLFTSGHGEPAIDDFGPSGLGDAARALRQDGYRVGTLFSLTSSVPEDCSVLAVVGAEKPFSSSELRDIGLFISRGGRLLVADTGLPGSGVKRVLDRLGIGRTDEGAVTAGTTDGSDIVVSDFGDHVVSVPLRGSAVVFASGSCRYRVPQAPHENGYGYSFFPLCPAATPAFAVAAEKGSDLGSDLAIRPARIVVIGDRSFFLNGALVSRANANRDFFLNSVAWLAGMDVSGAVGVAKDVLSVRMDRSDRIWFLACASVAVPLSAALLLSLAVVRRRRFRR